MTKFKCFINYDKEEQWLCEMAQKGYQLNKVSLGYSFYTAPPEKTVIKIDYRTFKNNLDFLEYCTLFEDSGWQHIAGTKNSGSQYFRKLNENGSDDIFSDSLSCAGRYKRLSDMWMSISVSFIPILIVMLTSDGWNMNGFVNPKALYFTPGLWETSGLKFLIQFLFETPFVIIRGYWFLILIFFILLYAIFAIKSWMLYRKTLHLDN